MLTNNPYISLELETVSQRPGLVEMTTFIYVTNLDSRTQPESCPSDSDRAAFYVLCASRDTDIGVNDRRA